MQEKLLAVTFVENSTSCESRLYVPGYKRTCHPEKCYGHMRHDRTGSIIFHYSLIHGNSN